MLNISKSKNVDLIFQNRTDAGESLAKILKNDYIKNSIVVALPRGGIPVAIPIIRLLKATLDLLVSKKIGAPENPELAIAAVTSEGDYVISPFIVNELDDDLEKYIQKNITDLIESGKKREIDYRKNFKSILSSHDYTGRNIILVDDGVAMGMTALAAIKTIKKHSPASIIFASPVISQEAYIEISKIVNKVVALKIPKDFQSVGAHYRDFSPVTEQEIAVILKNDE